MRINKSIAAQIIRDEAQTGSVDPVWAEKVDHLSRLCSEGVAATHIAFLGTAMLAKAVDHRVDLFAIKPKHESGNPYAYSARTLCHEVIVPLAAELGFSIGVTGREPLNNQPYFRMTRLGDETPIHQGSRAAFEYMLTLIHELQEMTAEDAAKEALRAFIAVRRKYQPRYLDHNSSFSITPDQLSAAIKHFVGLDSEGGRRAQAIVAGLMDVYAGPERVESGRINDPSRNYPGDVCVRSSADPAVWEKAIEVRDKSVSVQDVQIFGKKCVDMVVREAAVVMASDQQMPLDGLQLTIWANGFGIGITLFQGWDEFIEQALFWSEDPKPLAAKRALGFIYQRLITVEVSPASVSLWESIIEELGHATA